MALLHDYGCIKPVKGHNGRWALMKPLSDITLLDVYQALGEGSLFTIGLTDEHTTCSIEHSVNAALENVNAGLLLIVHPPLVHSLEHFGQGNGSFCSGVFNPWWHLCIDFTIHQAILLQRP